MKRIRIDWEGLSYQDWIEAEAHKAIVEYKADWRKANKKEKIEMLKQQRILMG